VAYDGNQAVEVAARVKPDIVCLDIGLPGIDGNEAARRIRKILPETLLIAITGWGNEDDRGRTFDAGFNHHLVKPVRMEELRELLRQEPRIASQRGDDYSRLAICVETTRSASRRPGKPNGQRAPK